MLTLEFKISRMSKRRVLRIAIVGAVSALFIWIAAEVIHSIVFRYSRDFGGWFYVLVPWPFLWLAMELSLANAPTRLWRLLSLALLLCISFNYVGCILGYLMAGHVYIAETIEGEMTIQMFLLAVLLNPMHLAFVSAAICGALSVLLLRSSTSTSEK